MAVESPATFNQASTYGAEQTRRAVSLWASSAGGVKASGDLAVTAPVSGMTVNVATGEILVPGSSSSIQGLYYGRVSSTSNLAIAASNPSNPRIDMVYAAITDAAYTGATNTFAVAVATGTPTSGATLVNLTGAPALPTSAIILAYCLVPANATNIITADLSDQRVQFVVSNAASLVSTSTQTFAGKVSTPTVIVTGITGAITQTRLVGGTASGAPVSGTFAVNDVVPASDGTLRICTVAGSPGTFVQVGTAPAPIGWALDGTLYARTGIGYTSYLVVANQQHYIPLLIRTAVTATRIGVFVESGGASSTVRLGVYAADASTLQPTGSDLSSAGTVATTSAGLQVATISLALSANTLYWLSAVQQGGSAPNLSATATQEQAPYVTISPPSFAAGASKLQTGVSGALGAAAPTTTSPQAPIIFLRG